MLRNMVLAAAVLSLTAMTAMTATAQTQATLVVGATVVPHCRISVDSGVAAGGPAVTASCAASSLRVLRVSTSRGESIQPRAGRQRRAGGDAVFVVSRTESAAVEGRTVVVTLDF